MTGWDFRYFSHLQILIRSSSVSLAKAVFRRYNKYKCSYVQISYFYSNVCFQNYISQRLRKWLQSFDNRLSLSDFSSLSQPLIWRSAHHEDSEELGLAIFYMLWTLFNTVFRRLLFWTLVLCIFFIILGCLQSCCKASTHIRATET